MREPCDGRLSYTVLRGECGRKDLTYPLAIALPNVVYDNILTLHDRNSFG